jgi:PRTRC genetic system ThiF family protein
MYLYHQSLTPLIQLTKLTPLAELKKLTIQKQYKVNVGRPDRVVILLVGCGGTGSFVAHILAQLANWAKSNGIDLRLYFVDPDKVEEKNLVRQNFCPAEVGYPKAFTLAWRYTAAFGLTITPVVERFSAELLRRYIPSFSPQGTLTLVVGAVDNVCARRDIAEAITAWLEQHGDSHDKLWWIDSGNERTSGQVLAGNSLEPEPLLSPLGYCIGLPLPHIQEPTLLMDRARPQPVDESLSCAELTLLGEQSAMINRLMATWLGLYLYRLLQSRDLDVMSTFINAQAGVTRSTPITGGRVVKPERPQRAQIPIRTAGEEATAEVMALRAESQDEACPNCGGEIIEGQDEWQGILIHVSFCAECHWREEGCPHCQGELVETEIELESGEEVPGLGCANCDWHEPIPEPQFIE